MFHKMPEIMNFGRNWSEHALGAAAGVISLDFVFLHELGHAALGHLDYLGSIGLKQRLREVDTVPVGVPIHVYHAMELQADYFSGVQLAQEILQPTGRWLTLINKYGHDQLSLLSLAILTIAVFGHIVSERQRELEAYDAQDHPHPEIRLEHFIGGLDATIKHLQPTELRTLKHAVKAAFDALLVSCNNLGMSEYAFPGYRNPAAFWARLAKTRDLVPVTEQWERFSLLRLP
jgi:hypothetical protein